MPGEYNVLATIHDVIDMGAFARHITSQIINFAQQNNWLGRQVVDLGCGSGVSLRWLAQHGYIVTGVDESTAMLNIAKQTVASQSLNVTWQQQNILDLQGVSGQDLAICLDTMHEFTSLREIEQVFRIVAEVIKDEKLFIFDIYTIEGLVHRNASGDSLKFDNQKLSVFVQNNFDYERQIQSRNYIIYRRVEDDLWEKETAQRALRAYPLQAVTALANRCGLEVVFVLNMNLSPHRPTDSTERVIIVAKKRLE